LPGPWEDTLITDVVNNDNGLIKEASWQWNSTINGPISEATHLTGELTWTHADDYTDDAPSWVSRLPFPEPAKALLGPSAQISMGVAIWQ
jgi:hypothetical protein